MSRQLKELSNTDIDKYFKDDEHYAGCLMKDEVSDELCKDKFTVINLQSSNAGNGTHWTLLYDCDPKIVTYIDSFGEVPPQSVEKFMKRRKDKKNQFNPVDLQAFSSEACGYYAIFFAKSLSSGKTLESILKQYFTANPKENEKLLRSYFAKH